MKNPFKRLSRKHRTGARHCAARHRYDRDQAHYEGLAGMISGQQMERLIGFVEGFMTFTPEQQSAWTGLTAILREHSLRMQQLNTVNPSEDVGEQRQSSDIALADIFISMERQMAAGLEALRGIRPAFEQFYASLSEKQQRALDELVLSARR